MNDQILVQDLLKRGIIIGPDHFVLGDGNGNPDRHVSLFVLEERLDQHDELKRTLLNRIWEQVSGLPFDIVVSANPSSFAVAQALAELTTEVRGKTVYACRCDSQPPVEGLRTALIHDNVINKGLQVSSLLDMMGTHGIRPLAITSLFTRISETHLFDLPLYGAIGRLIPSYDPADCPLCDCGIPINLEFGKGREFLQGIDKRPDISGL
jgi:orotate phosphoribosyltransferase